MTVRRSAALATAVAGVLLIGSWARPDIRGLTLVVRAAQPQGALRRLADLDSVPIRTWLRDIPQPRGGLRVRVYQPIGAARQTVVLVPGLHPAGIDEPRLMALARTLAEANLTVITPDIEELLRFEISPAATERIEAAALWAATGSGLAPGGRVGVMGISFSGGLAIVAAGRPSLRTHVLYVFSFGGHDDLRRVLEDEYVGDGDSVTPIGPAAHDYGVAILLLNMAEQLVPAGQLAPFQQAIRRFLGASYLERSNRGRAEQEFDALRVLAGTFPEPAATLLRYLNQRDVAPLAARLRPLVGLYVDCPALSPSRSPPPAAPIYLLHGRDDTVIPVGESRRLANRLRGTVPVRLLVTDLVSHSDADRPVRVASVMKLARFWGEMLSR